MLITREENVENAHSTTSRKRKRTDDLIAHISATAHAGESRPVVGGSQTITDNEFRGEDQQRRIDNSTSLAMQMEQSSDTNRMFLLHFGVMAS